MSKEAKENLHLPELSISGFRGIRTLEIDQLGQVTLLAGKNGVGKTTVLEAVQIFASRGLDPSVWMDVLHKHDEYLAAGEPDLDGDIYPPDLDLDSIFYGRGLSDELIVLIGPPSKKKQLKINFRRSVQAGEDDPTLRELTPLAANYGGKNYEIEIPIHFSSRERHLFERRRRLRQRTPEADELPAPVKCFALGPGLLRNEQVARLWDKAVSKGTAEERRVIEALRIVCGEDLERIFAIGDRDLRSGEQRHIIAQFKDQERPVPLRSLGDGAVRVFGLALALATSRNGFLVIDEVENGIHYSIQAEVWKLLLRTAKANNVQVIATTHGWDCIKQFSRVASEEQEIEGRLIRLEKDGVPGNLRAVEYSEEDLLSATQYGSEVR